MLEPCQLTTMAFRSKASTKVARKMKANPAIFVID